MSVEAINLKIHSQFSICEGAVKIDKLINYCKEHSVTAVGLCDSENLSGALEFSTQLKKEGIQPIIGTKIYIKENIDGKITYGTASLYAKNQIGYKNLLKLSSKSYLDLQEHDDKPNINLNILKKYHEGIIILIGGSFSFFSDLLVKNKDEYCFNEVKKLKDIFNENIC